MLLPPGYTSAAMAAAKAAAKAAAWDAADDAADDARNAASAAEDAASLTYAWTFNSGLTYAASGAAWDAATQDSNGTFFQSIAEMLGDQDEQSDPPLSTGTSFMPLYSEVSGTQLNTAVDISTADFALSGIQIQNVLYSNNPLNLTLFDTALQPAIVNPNSFSQGASNNSHVSVNDGEGEVNMTVHYHPTFAPVPIATAGIINVETMPNTRAADIPLQWKDGDNTDYKYAYSKDNESLDISWKISDDGLTLTGMANETKVIEFTLQQSSSGSYIFQTNYIAEDFAHSLQIWSDNTYKSTSDLYIFVQSNASTESTYVHIDLADYGQAGSTVRSGIIVQHQGDAFEIAPDAQSIYTFDTSSDKSEVTSALKGNDIINGTDGEDIIKGHDGNDLLLGLDGDDILFGGNGQDILDGGKGDDFLDGEEGVDILKGGLGSDLFKLDIKDILVDGNGDDMNELLKNAAEIKDIDGLLFTENQLDGMTAMLNNGTIKNMDVLIQSDDTQSGQEIFNALKAGDDSSLQRNNEGDIILGNGIKYESYTYTDGTNTSIVFIHEDGVIAPAE